MRVERNDLPFTSKYRQGQVLRMPIAHGEGNYEDSEANLDRLEAENRVVFRYVSPEGVVDEAWNTNGSARSIGGVTNERGNVIGLMPHPERCAEQVLGNTDGLPLFAAAVSAALRPGTRPAVATRPVKPKVVRRPAARR
jgi:phosphoribosylformylglycinamidine synthase